jgi:hypothetical protein
VREVVEAGVAQVKWNFIFHLLDWIHSIPFFGSRGLKNLAPKYFQSERSKGERGSGEAAGIR